MIALDGKNWFAFEVPINVADLLQCGRQAIDNTLSAGLRGRRQLTAAHRNFLRGLNTFLVNNTSFQ